MHDVQTLDLEFHGVAELIASFLAPVDDGFVLFDPGPASTIAAVERRIAEAGYELAGLRAVCSTHVHLDRAGGAGVLARRTGCTVPCSVSRRMRPASSVIWA